MNTVAIIQARLGSTRLPAKVFEDIGGEPMLARVVNRVERAEKLDGLCVATTELPEDDRIADWCVARGVSYSRGPVNDVLARYLTAARSANANVIVRITSDCPFIDPLIIDQTVEMFESGAFDYVSNTLERSYPHGLDVECFSYDALVAADHAAKLGYERVHVTPYLYQDPKRFRLGCKICETSTPEIRWTVDTEDDLNLARALYDRLGNQDQFSWKEALAAYSQEPNLSPLNAHIQQKSLEEG